MRLRKAGEPISGPFPSGATPSSYSSPSQHLGQGPSHLWHMVWPLRSGRALHPEDPSGAKRSQHLQVWTCLQREEPEICRAGQRGLISRKGVQPRRREEEASGCLH